MNLPEQLTPTPTLVEVARAMFKDAWAQCSLRAASIAQVIERDIAQVDRQISTALDRVIEASSPFVISAFERRITELEHSKLVLQEKRGKSVEKKGTFDELFELAFDFLSNPSKLWRSGRLDLQKLVLRMTFVDAPTYARVEGFRTPKTTMPSAC